MTLRADRQKPPDRRSGPRVWKHRVTGDEKHSPRNGILPRSSPGRGTGGGWCSQEVRRSLPLAPAQSRQHLQARRMTCGTTRLHHPPRHNNPPERKTNGPHHRPADYPPDPRRDLANPAPAHPGTACLCLNRTKCFLPIRTLTGHSSESISP